MFDAVATTRKLVQFDTTNPPGNELACGLFVADLLEEKGFAVERQKFGEDRINVVANWAGTDENLDPLLLTGHLDTVPMGELEWAHDPLGGEIIYGKLYGRGSSDMKSGLAAMMAAAFAVAAEKPRRGLKLVFTSGEETGLDGARHFIDTGEHLGRASAMIVGEPTANQYSNAHKGAMYIRAILRGKTAHSSTPELGVNAIYKAARAITAVSDYGFNVKPHPQLGAPTINVGMIRGGLNVNSVADRAEFSIDIRTNAMQDQNKFYEDLQTYLGDDVELILTHDMAAVSTGLDDPFVRLVSDTCRNVLASEFNPDPAGLPFATDAACLHPHYQCPTVILGPGEQSIMHQTDEYCYVERIHQAVEIYTNIATEWCVGD